MGWEAACAASVVPTRAPYKIMGACSFRLTQVLCLHTVTSSVFLLATLDVATGRDTLRCTKGQTSLLYSLSPCAKGTQDKGLPKLGCSNLLRGYGLVPSHRQLPPAWVEREAGVLANRYV